MFSSTETSKRKKVFEEPRKLILLDLLMKTPLYLYHQLEYFHWLDPEKATKHVDQSRFSCTTGTDQSNGLTGFN